MERPGLRSVLEGRDRSGPGDGEIEMHAACGLNVEGAVGPPRSNVNSLRFVNTYSKGMHPMMETSRLTIRRFFSRDWQDLYEYLSDEEVVRFEPYSTFGKEQAIKEAEKRTNDDSFWAVCLKENDKLIGNLYFCQQEPKEFMIWEIGYVFNRAYHGKGYATESADRLLKYGFETCNAHRIQAHCDPKNIASWRLLERLGMRREAHFIKKSFFHYDEQGNPLWHDAYEYAILRDEWFERS